MIVIVSSKKYLNDVTRDTLENASMLFILYGDRFDLIKNIYGKVLLGRPMEELSIYLMAAAEKEMT